MTGWGNRLEEILVRIPLENVRVLRRGTVMPDADKLHLAQFFGFYQFRTQSTEKIFMFDVCREMIVRLILLRRGKF